MTGMFTKEDALALVLQNAQETNYPLDRCNEYSDAWEFVRCSAPLSAKDDGLFIGDPNAPIAVNKTTGTWEYCIHGFYPADELASHVYNIDAAGTFTELPLKYLDCDLDDEDMNEDKE